MARKRNSKCSYGRKQTGKIEKSGKRRCYTLKEFKRRTSQTERNIAMAKIKKAMMSLKNKSGSRRRSSRRRSSRRR